MKAPVSIDIGSTDQKTIEIAKKYYIYKITNLINNKIYIGQTCNLKRRWNQHKRAVKIPEYPIHYAMKKYGIQNFKIEIIKSLDSLYDSNVTELELINHYNAQNHKIGYNLRPGGATSLQSPETKLKIKNSMLKLSIKLSDAAKKHLSESRVGQGNPAYGTKHSKKHLALIRKSLLGNTRSYKLTQEQADEIRNLFIKNYTRKYLAKTFNVSIGTIRNILINKVYKINNLSIIEQINIRKSK